MDCLRNFAFRFSAVLAAVFLCTALPIWPTSAEIVTVDPLADLQAAQVDRSHVADFLRREEVRRQMIDLGVDPAEIEKRIGTLPDGDIRALAERIDLIPAEEGTAGLLILVAIVVVAVFLATDVMGVTDIFPFIDARSDRSP